MKSLQISISFKLNAFYLYVNNKAKIILNNTTFNFYMRLNTVKRKNTILLIRIKNL